MNDIPYQVSSFAQVIQLAVAPVFLLAGVGASLGVLSTSAGPGLRRRAPVGEGPG